MALSLGCLLVLLGFAIVASASTLATNLLQSDVAGDPDTTRVIAAGAFTLLVGGWLVLMDRRP